jgi:hypothetical protein
MLEIIADLREELITGRKPNRIPAPQPKPTAHSTPRPTQSTSRPIPPPIGSKDEILVGIDLTQPPRQRLTFLPGLLKGLTARANYTYLQAKGKFAGTIGFNPGQVAGFIPRAYNVGLLYNYRKFGASFDVNYTGKYPVTYSLTAPGNGNRYRKDWTVMNVGLTYEIFRDTKAFISLNNIAQQGPEEYMFEQTRTRSIWIVPRTLKFGITGQF